MVYLTTMDFKKIFYKKKFLGKVEKDGKVYKKYARAPRFPFLNKKALIFVIFVLLVFCAAYLFILYRSHLAAEKNDFEDNYKEGVTYFE